MTETIKRISLQDLGFNSFVESNLESMGGGRGSLARVIAEYKEAYRVRDTENEYLAKVTGKQLFEASSREDYPAVGDWVTITRLDPESAMINSILPRKTMLKRKYSNKFESQIIAANIDKAFIMESVDRDYNLNRLERYLALAYDGKIKPVILLNKIDLISASELDQKVIQIKNRLSYVDLIATSTLTTEGCRKLEAFIKRGETCCLLGSSGVGKSSLINRLLGKDSVKTASISDHTGRGKHTTSGRDMYFLENGGIIVDNPGMREIGMTESDAGLEGVFDEIYSLSVRCKYVDCTHEHEPGCAVRAALEAGTLDKDRYSHYLKLKGETEYYEMTKLEKRRKDREFGQFIKKVKDQMKRKF